MGEDINTVQINMITRYAWSHYRSVERGVCDGSSRGKALLYTNRNQGGRAGPH